MVLSAFFAAIIKTVKSWRLSPSDNPAKYENMLRKPCMEVVDATGMMGMAM